MTQQRGREPLPQAQVDEQYDAQDLFGVDPETLDPEMHYRFVSDSHQRQTRHRALGYRPVLRSETEVRLTTDTDAGGAEDLIRVGDTILMCTPKERYERRAARKLQLSHSRLATPEGQFRKKARAAEAEVVTNRQMKGLPEE